MHADNILQSVIVGENFRRDLAFAVQALEELPFPIGKRKNHRQQFMAVGHERLRPLRKLAPTWRVVSAEERKQHSVGLGHIDGDMIDRYGLELRWWWRVLSTIGRVSSNKLVRSRSRILG